MSTITRRLYQKGTYLCLLSKETSGTLLLCQTLTVVTTASTNIPIVWLKESENTGLFRPSFKDNIPVTTIVGEVKVFKREKDLVEVDPSEIPRLENIGLMVCSKSKNPDTFENEATNTENKECSVLSKNAEHSETDCNEIFENDEKGEQEPLISEIFSPSLLKQLLECEVDIVGEHMFIAFDNMGHMEAFNSSAKDKPQQVLKILNSKDTRRMPESVSLTNLKKPEYESQRSLVVDILDDILNRTLDRTNKTRSSNSKIGTGTSKMMFSAVKYCKTGDLNPGTVNLLQEGGAKSISYLSSLATHCIVGDTPEYQDIGMAEEMLELPVVTEEWVIASARCGDLLPVKGFSTTSSKLFGGITLVIDSDTLDKGDCDRLWVMISWYGGRVVSKEEVGTGTHLVCGGLSKEKERSGLILVVPDWVVESIQKGEILEERDYHPSLFFELQETKYLSDGVVYCNNKTAEYHRDDHLDVTEDLDVVSLLKKEGDYFEDDVNATIKFFIPRQNSSTSRRSNESSVCSAGSIVSYSNVGPVNIIAKDEDMGKGEVNYRNENDVVDVKGDGQCHEINLLVPSSLMSTVIDLMDKNMAQFKQNGASRSLQEEEPRFPPLDYTSISSFEAIPLQNSASDSMIEKTKNNFISSLEICTKFPDFHVSISHASSKNSEFLHAKGSSACKRKRSEADTSYVESNNPMKKCMSEIKPSSFCVNPVIRRGRESDEFHRGYSRREANALIDFIKRQDLYSMTGGTRVWKIIEKAAICPGRSWQSMKFFFLKYLIKQLPNYGATIEELDDRDRGKTGVDRTKFVLAKYEGKI